MPTSADQIEILRRSVRYLLAAEQVKGKAKQLNLTDEQKDQLREREATDWAAAESAFLKLYKVPGSALEGSLRHGGVGRRDRPRVGLPDDAPGDPGGRS